MASIEIIPQLDDIINISTRCIEILKLSPKILGLTFSQGGSMNRVIKRNGQEVPFEIEKIKKAISSANGEADGSDKISEISLNEIVDEIEKECEKIPHALNVESIQDIVEEAIMNEGYFEVARKYVRYRYRRELVRKNNSTDDTILSLIDSTNEEIKQENSNKNPVINSTQRDYVAGEVSKDISRRLLLPQDVIDANDAGIIHFHKLIVA